MSRVLRLVAILFAILPAAFSQIPANHIRVHYFRPDGNYLGWTMYAYGDTTEDQSNFSGGPVQVTGQDSYGAYFDIGVTNGATNVGLIIHKGNLKDPGPDMHANPSAQGNQFWAISGSPNLQTTQPSTTVAPPIPASHARIHYHRPDNVYVAWTVYAFFDTTEDTSNFNGGPVFVSGYDTYGAYFDVGLSSSYGHIGFIVHNIQQGIKDPGPDMFLNAPANEAWVLSGSNTVYLSQPQTEYTTDPAIPASHARIHYYRPDNAFASWTVYAFGDTTEDTSNYGGGPVFVSGYDPYGAFYDVGLTQNPHDLGFIVHNISTGQKDPGPDMHLDVSQYREAWVISGDPTVYTSQPTAAQLLNAAFNKLQAFWIDRSTIAIQPQYLQSGWTYYLSSDKSAHLQVTATGVTGGKQLQLVPYSAGLTSAEAARFPQLSGYAILHLSKVPPQAGVEELVKGELAVSAVGQDGALKYATGVQYAGVLDDEFYYSGKLGISFPSRNGGNYTSNSVTLSVWAPTAQSMSVLLFNGEFDTTPAQTISMTEQPKYSGVWVANGDLSWANKYYQLSVTVYHPQYHQITTNIATDPYSVDLALNGIKSKIVDLSDPATMPSGWRESRSPALSGKNQLSLYELHIRDFSIGDPTVPSQYQGTYLAFTQTASQGMKHLKSLAQAGLKAVHLMPSFHFASINEDKSQWQYPNQNILTTNPPDSSAQQAEVSNVKNSDGYNWGYDPVHYMAPEGGYAFDPSQRVKEYRAMVQALHAAGLRVVQDVVFNHTSSVGLNPNSVLDLIEPIYYYRLDGDGTQLTGSCCNDTASEHLMFDKLIVDTTLLNAKYYKIDGFRFDLMSFSFVSNLQHVTQALNTLTLANSGVDGSKIYLYGEGFDFGEVANNALGVNASQKNLYGYGVGTFNDRIRDGVRGGSPFTDKRVQGFATGLFTDSSAFTNGSGINQQDTLGTYSDWIKVGLTGNLRDYTLTDHYGNTVTGQQVNYNGQGTGYTASPIEAVSYASVHDNQILFDAVQIKSSSGDDAATRARRQAFANSIIALGQSVPFFAAGDDLLRSKDMDQNSYNSGDWFNKIDWSYNGNNWGIGLPMASENQGDWGIEQPLLQNAALKPSPADIAHSRDAFQEFLRIRYSSGLFTLQTFNEVQQNLHFLNNGPSQVPGVIVMKLDANGGNYGPFQHIVVVFNGSNATVNITDPALQGLNLQLHPIQASSSDPVVRNSTFNGQQGTATVPGLTTAVFVQ